MSSSSGSGRRRYVSASELADFAFCPRSQYYRLHPEGRRPAAGSLVRERSGVEYHRRTIGSDRRWTAASPLPWLVAVLAGAAILALLALSILGRFP
ncbi:MAG: hypothetical protein L3J96_06675 [Thermoplasmata archaeon]|nr:hypothetical protein [Thermoplasmata archaeon]